MSSESTVSSGSNVSSGSKLDKVVKKGPEEWIDALMDMASNPEGDEEKTYKKIREILLYMAYFVWDPEEHEIKSCKFHIWNPVQTEPPICREDPGDWDYRLDEGLEDQRDMETLTKKDEKLYNKFKTFWEINMVDDPHYRDIQFLSYLGFYKCLAVKRPELAIPDLYYKIQDVQDYRSLQLYLAYFHRELQLILK